MSSRFILIAGIMLPTLLCVESVFAGHLRCGQHIIQDGQRHGPGNYEVLKKCGEPTSRTGNTWIYERPGGRTAILRFNDAGALQSITYASA